MSVTLEDVNRHVGDIPLNRARRIWVLGVVLVFAIALPGLVNARLLLLARSEEGQVRSD